MSFNYDIQSEISQQPKDKFLWFHSDELSRGIRLIEIEPEQWFPGAEIGEEIKTYCFMGREFSFYEMKNFWALVTQQCEFIYSTKLDAWICQGAAHCVVCILLQTETVDWDPNLICHIIV